MNRSAAATAWLSALCLAFVGCGESGPPRVAVRGTVKLDGRDLDKGFIAFIPAGETKGPKAGGRIDAGRFEIPQAEGPMVGMLRVEIREEQDLGFELDDPEAFNAHAPRGQLPPNRVPPKYNRSSELTVTTRADGPNEFEFELKTR